MTEFTRWDALRDLGTVWRLNEGKIPFWGECFPIPGTAAALAKEEKK